MKHDFQFQQKNSLEKRKEVATRILSKYPDRIPVIVERYKKSNLPKLSKNKFLVPENITMGTFCFEVRKQLKIDSHTAIFMFVGLGTIQSGSTLISSVYQRHKNPDGFLYIVITSENTFGGGYGTIDENGYKPGDWRYRGPLKPKKKKYQKFTNDFGHTTIYDENGKWIETQYSNTSPKLKKRRLWCGCLSIPCF